MEISRVVKKTLQGYFCLARQKAKNNPRRCLGQSLFNSPEIIWCNWRCNYHKKESTMKTIIYYSQLSYSRELISITVTVTVTVIIQDCN